MLTIEHIRNIKINKNKLKIYETLPQPEYIKKEEDKKFIVLGDSAISDLFEISNDEFNAQINKAREYGVSYLITTQTAKPIGISAAISSIKNDKILNRNLIIPKQAITKASKLWRHYIISFFTRNKESTSESTDGDNIYVAGWTDANKLVQFSRVNKLPPTFVSKLQCYSMPCKYLEPINLLIDMVKTRFAIV